MTYLHLLSPSGEPFEILEKRAGKLLAEGWTFNAAPLENAITAAITEPFVTAAPTESNGAIADAEDLAIDVAVEAEEQPVEAAEVDKPRKRRPQFTSDV